MASDSRISSISAEVRTVGQAKAVLGAALNFLHSAYTIATSIGVGINPSEYDANLLNYWATGETRDAAIDLLDGSRAYTEGIYATLPKEANTWVLDSATTSRIGVALQTSFKAVYLVGNAAKEVRPNFVKEFGDSLIVALKAVTPDINIKLPSFDGFEIPWWKILGVICLILFISIYVHGRAVNV